MVLIYNSWRPDTCKCKVRYQIETDEPSPRTKQNFEIIIDCPEHSGLTCANDFFNVLLDENTRKNKIVNKIITDFPELTDNTEGFIQLKFGLVTWSWTGVDASRVFTIDLSATTLTQTQKDAVQSWADTNIGVGKVLVIG